MIFSRSQKHTTEFSRPDLALITFVWRCASPRQIRSVSETPRRSPSLEHSRPSSTIPSPPLPAQPLCLRPTSALHTLHGNPSPYLHRRPTLYTPPGASETSFATSSTAPLSVHQHGTGDPWKRLTTPVKACHSDSGWPEEALPTTHYVCASRHSSLWTSSLSVR